MNSTPPSRKEQQRQMDFGEPPPPKTPYQKKPGERGAVPLPWSGKIKAKIIKTGERPIRDFAGALFGQRILPKLSDAGAFSEAVQFASVRAYIPRIVQKLLSDVFPDIYKDPVKMNEVVATIRDDNILGGYDQAVQELNDLKAKGAKPHEIKQQEGVIDAIEKAHDIKLLDATVSATPAWQKPYIARWAKHVSTQMDNLYNEYKGYNFGTPQETRGRYFNARMNLLPDWMEERMADFSDPEKTMPQSEVTNYRNPNIKKDQFMRQALLTGKYSADAEAVLTNSFASRWRNIALMRFYQSLVDHGAAEWVDPGMKAPESLKGIEARKWVAEIPALNPETGESYMKLRTMAVQAHLIPEIKHLVHTESAWKQNKVLRALTTFQLYQAADAVAHGKNMHSVLVHSLNGTSYGREMSGASRSFPVCGLLRKYPR